MIPAIALITTYCIAIIEAGHGIGPIGMLLVMGSPSYWFLGQISGWVSIAALIVVTIRYRKTKQDLALVQLKVSIGIYLSWVLFALVASSEGAFWKHLWLHFILSAPFQMALLLFVRIFTGAIAQRISVVQMNSNNAPNSDARYRSRRLA